ASEGDGASIRVTCGAAAHATRPADKAAGQKLLQTDLQLTGRLLCARPKAHHAHCAVALIETNEAQQASGSGTGL
ncbi:MAG: hypothetical protein ACREQ1_03635, partial [Woeseiaceae bacterium]